MKKIIFAILMMGLIAPLQAYSSEKYMKVSGTFPDSNFSLKVTSQFISTNPQCERCVIYDGCYPIQKKFEKTVHGKSDINPYSIKARIKWGEDNKCKYVLSDIYINLFEGQKEEDSKYNGKYPGQNVQISIDTLSPGKWGKNTYLPNESKFLVFTDSYGSLRAKRIGAEPGENEHTLYSLPRKDFPLDGLKVSFQ